MAISITLRGISFYILSFICTVMCSRKVSESKLPLHQEQDGLSSSFLPLEHSFDQGASPKFTNRGMLSFRSNKPGPGTYLQNAQLTVGDKRKLKELAHHNGIYRIRVPTSLEANGDSSYTQYVSTFTSACAIFESQLSDEITVHVDQSGNVLGLSVISLKGTCDLLPVEASSFDTFNTTVYLSQTVPGPVPETQSYIQRLEEEREQKEKGQGQDNRSFFGKYWMYIVPVVLFVLLSSGGDQQRS